MTDIEILLPKLGESITSATVVQWFKKEGDAVAEDEPLLEVTTDKVNSEIPSTVSGVLKKIVAGPDVTLDVGEPLCLIVTDGSVAAPVEEKVETVAEESGDDQSDYYSPAVLRLAREKGIPMEDLDKMKGSGAGGRITKKDIQNYTPCPLKKAQPGTERVKMDGMRKAIADNLVKSFYEAPHASLVIEVDITDALETVAKEKEAFLKKNGYKLSITSFVARAIAKAATEFPLLNASLEGDTIVVKKFVNLGIAVSVDQGIMVPVIQNCHTSSITEIAGDVAELSRKARGNTLTPDDTQNGTITMTNFGMGGTTIGIPIIRHPEVAIVGVGAIQKKVCVLDDDSFGVRKVVNISLTFDHRVLDGMYGCSFLAALKTHLETDSQI